MILPGSSTSTRWLGLLAALAAAVWLWACWCLFPVSDWNDVRLAPAFALARGAPLYPGETSGAVGTWIYGPLPALLLWPATWASSAAEALLTAGALNLLLTVGAIAAVCAAWPAPAGRTLRPADRLLAATLAIALWPGATFQYLQADNFAVALGLLGNLLLVRTQSAAGRWGAAAFAVAGLACKQTSLGVVAAQIVWLGAVAGRGEALRHLGRCAGLGLAGGTAIVGAFGWERIRLNLFVLPSALPWAEEPVRRLLGLAPELSIHLLAPALILLLCRRAVWARESPLLLPSLAWLFALPPGVLSLMKIGGNINSLQGFTLWLPAALLAGLAAARGARRASWLLAGGALVAAAICGERLARLPALPWHPLVEHYRQADYLARTFHGEIWFPWNPLVTIYRENRFDHGEDGLYVRFLAGHAITQSHARANLPPRMCVIALPRGAADWGIALSLRPAGAQRTEFGLWTLYSWPPGPATGAPPLPPSLASPVAPRD
jgi:hypothetical protein